jgi:hypothetical protein
MSLKADVYKVRSNRMVKVVILIASKYLSYGTVMISFIQKNTVTIRWNDENDHHVSLCVRFFFFMGISMSICEKTTTLISLDLELVHHFTDDTVIGYSTIAYGTRLLLVLLY